MTRPLGLCLILCSLTLDARRFSLDDPGRVTRVSDAQISSDARSIAILVSRANFEDNRWEPQLVLVDTASGAHRVLSSERRGLASPRWSPAGDRLAFLAQPTPGAKSQIYVLPMSGGEAAGITSAENGVQQFSWKPDGTESMGRSPRLARAIWA